MKRSLLTQMRNEWRENIWLVVELLVISLVVWYITLSIYTTIFDYNRPRGFEPEDVYLANISILTPEDPLFVDMGEETASNNLNDLQSLVNSIRNLPSVESVAIARNGAPYNYNYHGTGGVFENDKDSVFYSGNKRVVTPDYVKVLKIKSLTGMSEQQMADTLKNFALFLSPSESFVKSGGDVDNMVGRKIPDLSESPVAGLIETIRRTDYEYHWGGTILMGVPDGHPATLEFNNMLIRVKPGMGTQFLEEFMKDNSLIVRRNVTLSDPQELMKIRSEVQRTQVLTMRRIIALTCFLLFILFLGLLGTFWFRVQSRSGEIALRMVCGAAPGQVFRRLITEAFILFFIAAIIGAAIVLLVFHKGDRWMLWPYTVSTGWEINMILATLISLASISLIILLGLFIPARRAMAIRPAIILKDL